MRKKGVSAEEKCKRILDIYYERVLLTSITIDLERSLQPQRDWEVWCQERSR